MRVFQSSCSASNHEMSSVSHIPFFSLSVLYLVTFDMAKHTKHKTRLAKKIAHLQLQLAPLVPLPDGPPHPAFPHTLLEYHLLTEEELDAIASWYHQSTPCVWTFEYPATMNWDKAFLNASKIKQANAEMARRTSQPTEVPEWWAAILQDAKEPSAGSQSPTESRRRSSVRRWSTSLLNDSQRIAIKRRKVGKFIGLVGMDTPVDEIEGRIRFSMRQALKIAQEENRRQEERELSRRKI